MAEENDSDDKSLEQESAEEQSRGEPSSSSLLGSDSSKGKNELDLFHDVPMSIVVELGQTNVTISNLLQFQVGTVLELNKLAGEPLEILVNDREVAKGEVVVVNERYGIRLTDIIDPLEVES
ncbi:MAG: flagellar motor switch protein FliN [Bacteriovoracaceae bacterium]|nr:flagellar motor switch protein FliN [Bacteriovoracaceae bacterium]